MSLMAVHLVLNNYSSELIYQESIDSSENFEKKLFEEDRHIKREHCDAFPRTAEAMKIESLFVRMIAFVVNIVIDAVTLPFRLRAFREKKDELRNTLPIYKYLQTQGVPQKYLKHDRFDIIFYREKEIAPHDSDLKKRVENWLEEGKQLEIALGKEFHPVRPYFVEYKKHTYSLIDGRWGMNKGEDWISSQRMNQLKEKFIAL